MIPVLCYLTLLLVYDLYHDKRHGTIVLLYKYHRRAQAHSGTDLERFWPSDISKAVMEGSGYSYIHCDTQTENLVYKVVSWV